MEQWQNPIDSRELQDGLSAFQVLDDAKVCSIDEVLEMIYSMEDIEASD